MIDAILISAALAILAIGTFTDFRIREVPDWINYGGIAAGLGLRLLYSSLTFDWSYIIAGLLGFGVFLGVALAMFYLGQWGGGDSKMLMGIGALVGLELRPDSLLIAFFVNMLFVGALYGIFWSIYLAVSHRKKFIRQMNNAIKSRDYRKAKKILFLLVALLIILSFLVEPYVAAALLVSAFVLLVVFYSWLFLTSVEKISLLKSVPVEKLTEGDWIVRDIVVGGKRICGPKDLGISREQIDKLVKLKHKGKIRKVLIKEGMPFVPVFLISFVISLIWGNIALMFI